MKNLISKAIVGAATLVALASQAQTNSWNQMPTPNPSTEQNFLRGISGTSSSDVWAVGNYQTSPPGLAQYTSENLVMHWNGNNWTNYNVPEHSLNMNILWDVKSISTNNVWAVGEYGGNAQTHILHWNGSSWTSETVNLPGSSTLRSIAAISANDVWAVGGKAVVGNFLCFAYHYNGSSWTDVPVPPVGQERNEFRAVDGLSPNDVWAVGSFANNSSWGEFWFMAMHWDGSTWTNYPLPAAAMSSMGSLDAVKMIAPNDVWAVGHYLTGGTVMAHWDGTDWTMVPYDGGTGDFAALAPNDIYVVGGTINHWNGSTWAVADSMSQLPYPTLASATVLPNNEIWAAGRTADLDFKYHSLVYRQSAGQQLLTVSTPTPVAQPGSSVQLLAQPIGTGSFNYLWTSDDTAAFSDPTLPNPTVSPMADTRYAVNVTDQNGNSLQGMVKVRMGNPTAVPEKAEQLLITAGPNPFNRHLTLSTVAAEPVPAKVILVNVLGEVVWQKQVSVPAGQQEIPLLQRTAPLPGGMYVLSIETPEATHHVRLVKQ